MTAKTKPTSTRTSTAKKASTSKVDTSKLSTTRAAKTVTAKKATPRKAKPATSAPAKTKIGADAPPSAPIAAPAVVNAPQAVVMGPAMRKKQIIDAVVERSGLKKRDVKPVLDHLLAVMGDALAEGKELVVPPMGRIKTHKKKQAAKKTIFFAKIHQNMTQKPVGDIDPGLTSKDQM